MKQLFKLQQKYEKMRRQRDEARAELFKLRTINITIEPSAQYEVKEMHIDCEKKDFEVGKWYRSRYGITARFERPGIGTGYYSLAWGNWYMQDFKNWRLATPQEIEEVLTKRCKELGLFDGEFECLRRHEKIEGDKSTYYSKRIDSFWIGQNLAYEKGKFAKLVENRKDLIATTADIPESMLKFAVSDFGGRFYFNHTQLSDKSREYLSQFENVVIE